MPEKSTTPDLVGLVRRSYAAANSGDWDAVMGFFARDAVWDAPELFAFEGHDAIRGLFTDWVGAFEDVEIEVEDVLDLGNDVGFVIASMAGQLVGSTAQMRERYGAVYTWCSGLIIRVTSIANVDEARAAAEALAESRTRVGFRSAFRA